MSYIIYMIYIAVYCPAYTRYNSKSFVRLESLQHESKSVWINPELLIYVYLFIIDARITSAIQCQPTFHVLVLYKLCGSHKDLCKAHAIECTGTRAFYYFLVSKVNGDPSSCMVSILVLVVYSKVLGALPVTNTHVKNKKIRRCQHMGSQTHKGVSSINLRNVVNSTYQMKTCLRQWTVHSVILVYWINHCHKPLENYVSSAVLSRQVSRMSLYGVFILTWNNIF